MKGLKTVSVVEALAMTLRARVLDGQIDAGVGLTEADVAAEYDVSRPSAKTAISLLVHEGLLRREAHKSAYVPELSRKDVEDLFLVRIPLELESSGSLGASRSRRPRPPGPSRTSQPSRPQRRTARSSRPTSGSPCAC